MAVRTNLATYPFANRRLASLILGVTILVGALMAMQFGERLEVAEVNAKAVRAEVEGEQQQIRELRKRIPPPVTPDQLSPQERELLIGASALIERRVFPWSKLLRDLESNLGYDVRLTRINVALKDPSKVDLLRPGTAPMEISMVVIGKQLDNVLEMMRSLQATGRFREFRPRKQTVVEGTQEVEYEVEMTYTPK
jgi:hypothetical protein